MKKTDRSLEKCNLEKNAGCVRAANPRERRACALSGRIGSDAAKADDYGLGASVARSLATGGCAMGAAPRTGVESKASLVSLCGAASGTE